MKGGRGRMTGTMEITYLGLAAFKLKGSATVVTDPYSRQVGWAFPKVNADIVTVSHDHFDHNNAAGVGGTAQRAVPLVIQAPGEYEANGVAVYGYATFHDSNKGAQRGKNTVYLIYLDGLRVAHLGDLGHELSEKQVEELGGVDVLLIPVGGKYTLGPKEAAGVVEEIQPGIVIPMHYHLPGLAEQFSALAPVDEFMREVRAAEVAEQDKLTVGVGEAVESTRFVRLSRKV